MTISNYFVRRLLPASNRLASITRKDNHARISLRARGALCTIQIRVFSAGTTQDVTIKSNSENYAKARLHYEIPQRVRQKVVSASDAVALVRDGDTVSCSGFVAQGVAEAVLKALGERYDRTGHPNNLTLLFGGGPGDWDSRGLNHLGKYSEDSSKPHMLRRTIGSHYGQTPKVAHMALQNMVEAWTLPLGSVSRMIRAQATHSPGHITEVGIGTYIDPDISGGATNETALESPLHSKLVQKLDIDGRPNLMYKALPIHVAIIRGTTGDCRGNISIEEESVICDQKILAAAAKNSGGIVIAQVKRLAADGTIPCRSVAIPGPLVDAVVVVDEKDHDSLHPMSYVERNNPSLTGQIKTPQDEVQKMPLDVRKLIARRAFFKLSPDQIVNLGIGLPEGIASVAAEEDMLQYITLSTEVGVFGGLPASGHNFGPAYNATAMVEMNQMFDFYDGGGLDICFLGAAQIGKNGDVNVSRMSKDRLTGPGGFIDITQSTRRIGFVMAFTAKGLEVDIPGDGKLGIKQEGRVKKLVSSVFEKTFSGDEAVRRGQEVTYITERAVFRRTGKFDVLELVEVAPGIDLQKDILDQMEFLPAISPKLAEMDPRIFKEGKMNVATEFFGSLDRRFRYQDEENIMYLDLFGITLNTEGDIQWFFQVVNDMLKAKVTEKGKVALVVNYNGFDVRNGLEDMFRAGTDDVVEKWCKSVKRYSGAAFRRSRLGEQLGLTAWDAEKLYDLFDFNGDGEMSVTELRSGMENLFQSKLSPTQLSYFVNTPEQTIIGRQSFERGLAELARLDESTFGRFGKFTLEEDEIASEAIF